MQRSTSFARSPLQYLCLHIDMATSRGLSVHVWRDYIVTSDTNWYLRVGGVWLVAPTLGGATHTYMYMHINIRTSTCTCTNIITGMAQLTTPAIPTIPQLTILTKIPPRGVRLGARTCVIKFENVNQILYSFLSCDLLTSSSHKITLVSEWVAVGMCSVDYISSLHPVR